MAQADPDADAGDLAKRYPKAQIRDYDGDPARLTEMDALIAYLQMLGTLVDFKSAEAQELRHFADSWGLAFMLVLFVGFVGWAFRPGSRDLNTKVAHMIFEDDDNG